MTRQEKEEQIVTQHYKEKIQRNRIICITICGILLAIFGVYNIFFTIGRIPSSSMVPTLPVGSNIIIDKFAYSTSDPARGDIICFQKEGKLVTKRVIGLPGERVTISNGEVYVNNQLLHEVYLTDAVKEQGTFGSVDIVVPSDSYYVLGDNRSASRDSRYWSEPCVKSKDIKGRVFANFSVLKWYYHELPVYESEEIRDGN